MNAAFHDINATSQGPVKQVAFFVSVKRFGILISSGFFFYLSGIYISSTYLETALFTRAKISSVSLLSLEDYVLLDLFSSHAYGHNQSPLLFIILLLRWICCFKKPFDTRISRQNVFYLVPRQCAFHLFITFLCDLLIIHDPRR